MSSMLRQLAEGERSGDKGAARLSAMCSSTDRRSTLRRTSGDSSSNDLKRTQPWKARPFAPQSVTDPCRAEEVTARGAIPDIDVSCRWVITQGVMKSHFLIAIGLDATLLSSSSSSFAPEEARFGSEQEVTAMIEK